MEELYSKLKHLASYEDYKEWYELVKPILESKEFQKRKLMKHHDESVFDHCIRVSYISFKYSKKFHADSKNCAIAGLMHDFYPHAWQYSESLKELGDEYMYYFLPNTKKVKNPFKMHGFTHAKEAKENFKKHYADLSNKRIENAIERHMFPLNITPPKYKEGWIVTLADKVDTAKNMPKVKEWPKYIGLGNKKNKE